MRKCISYVIIFSIIIVTVLTSCGKTMNTASSEESGSLSSADSVSATVTPQPTPLISANCLKIVLPGTAPKNLDKVTEKINEKLSDDKLDISVSLEFYESSIYDDKISLLQSSNVAFDAFYSDHDDYLTFISSGIASDITSTVNNNSGFKSLIPDSVWSCSVYDKKNYGIPVYTYNINHSAYGLLINSSLVNTSGADANSTISNIDDLVSYLNNIQGDSGKLVIPYSSMTSSTESFSALTDMFPFFTSDRLGLLLSDSSGNVTSFLESDQFKKLTDIYDKLHSSALTDDSVVTQDVIDSRLQNGDFLAVYGNISDIFSLKDNKIPMNFVSLISSGDTQGYVGRNTYNYICVPSISKNGKSFISFMNWLYSSQDNYDLFTYGIKDTDYKLDDNGRIEMTGDYSIDQRFTAYLPLMRFDVSTSDSLINALKQNISSEQNVSYSTGFFFSEDKVSEICRRLKNDITTYIDPIRFGTEEYSSKLKDAVDQLKADGLQTYIDEYKSQYNKYLTDNGLISATPEPSSESNG
jgi:putative aldouronate transport system substrate-binding protein